MGSLAFGGEFFLPALLDSRGTSQQCPKRWRLHNHEADAGCAPPPRPWLRGPLTGVGRRRVGECCFSYCR